MAGVGSSLRRERNGTNYAYLKNLIDNMLNDYNKDLDLVYNHILNDVLGGNQ